VRTENSHVMQLFAVGRFSRTVRDGSGESSYRIEVATSARRSVVCAGVTASEEAAVFGRSIGNV
jgi:hypothetical protein